MPESVADLEAEYPDNCLIAKVDARDIAAAANIARDTGSVSCPFPSRRSSTGLVDLGGIVTGGRQPGG
ncbi:hypothetical protein [Nonomuraea sp. NPDC049480]|uniref:hypothetical protein n=1 Tax=Nonomuraea sp. NPDC049480 TaxID=3364353 RepID=UPI00379C8B0A